MKHYVVTCASALVLMSLVACSGAPEKGDANPVPDVERADEEPRGPIEVTEAWLESDEPPPAIRSIVGDSPLVERIWRERDYYRAVAVDPDGPAADGEGDAVLITLERAGDSWKVSVAEPGPASTLWPSL